MPDIAPPLEESPAAPTLSPFELLSVLWRRRLIVIATVVIAVAVSLVLSSRSPKQYGASAQLLFRNPGFAQTVGAGAEVFTPETQEAQRTIQTNIDVVASPNVAATAETLLPHKEPVGSLLESVSVSPNSNADVATISATRSTPTEAALVANAFAEGYIIYRRNTDRTTIQQAEEQLERQAKAASPEDQAGILASVRKLSLLRSLQTGNAEVIARAQPNTTPVSPKPKRDGELGFVVGLLLGSALALLVDFLDRRLKTLDDFERACPDYPLTASVPHTPAGSAVPGELTGPTGEAYRILREGLRFLDPSPGSRCYVITSAEEGEGKSTVAVNLAMALAAVGRRVILLEADMRRPTAALQLGADTSGIGLSELLVSDTDIEEALVRIDGEPNLRLLPAGIVPPNSADLLSAGRMSEVLASARDLADVLIVDCPPLLPVADTRVLLRQPAVNGVVMIGRAGVSRRDRVREAARILRQSSVRVFGLVVTDVRANSTSSYYEYAMAEPDPRSTRPAPRPNKPPRNRNSGGGNRGSGPNRPAGGSGKVRSPT